MNSRDLINADEIVQAIKQRDRIFNLVPGLSDSPAFLLVVQQYISLYTHIEQLARMPADEYGQQHTTAPEESTVPPWAKNHRRWLESEVVFARQKPCYLREQSESTAHTIACHIAKLHARISFQSSLGEGVSWDRKWKCIHDEHIEKQQRLASCLREAADLFESGQTDAGVYPSLTGYRKIDEQAWCGTEQLREWASTVEMSPVEVVFPVVRPVLSGIAVSFDSIGTRGGAANPESALRAMIVRETAFYVPKTTPHRYKTIADLAACIGIDVSRHYVRSLLLKGKT